MILKRIKLERFCGFENFDLDLGEFNVLVGLNNSGKTTILRAITFVLDSVRVGFGDGEEPRPGVLSSNPVRIPLQELADRLGVIDFDLLYAGKKRQGGASITLTFDSNGRKIELRSLCEEANNNVSLRITYDGELLGRIAEDVSGNVVNEIFKTRAEFVPPPGVTSSQEPVRDWNNLKNEIAKGRFAESWRNRLHWMNEGQDPEFFQRVVDRVRLYVGDVRVRPPRRSRSQPIVEMNYLEDGVEYDISASGAGLRTLITLATAIELTDAKILLFDEPDAHLHSSVQRQVAAFLQEAASDGRQVLVASHAPDVVDEVPVASLVWIDRSESSGKCCDEVGQILVDLGAMSNSQALRELGADTALFVEGNPDRRVFSALLDRCSKGHLNDRIRFARLRSRGAIKHLPQLQSLLRDVKGLTVIFAALIDADYTQTEPTVRSSTTDGVLVLELPCKELENLFILSASTITDAAKKSAELRAKRTGTATDSPSAELVEAKIEEITSSADLRAIMEPQWLCCWAEENGRDLNEPGNLKAAGEAFNDRWADLEWRRRCCPGKKVLSRIRQWLSAEYKLSLTLGHLIEFYEPSSEIKTLFDQLDEHVCQVGARTAGSGGTSQATVEAKVVQAQKV